MKVWGARKKTKKRQGRMTVQLGAQEVRGTERQGQLAEHRDARPDTFNEVPQGGPGKKTPSTGIPPPGRKVVQLGARGRPGTERQGRMTVQRGPVKCGALHGKANWRSSPVPGLNVQGTARQGRMTMQLGAREVRGTERQGQLAELKPPC
jgi:hypothetical protein